MESRNVIRVALLAVVVCSVWGLATPAMALPSFTGSLSTATAPPGITATGLWASAGPTTMQWTVSQLADLSWNYTYCFTVPSGDIKTLLIETSPDFTTANVLSASGTFTSFSVQSFSPPDALHPGLPGTIHALDFEGINTTAAAITFNSTRAPVWGDFYGLDGTGPPVANAAWDKGFPLADPPDPPSNGTVDNKILVPDTQTFRPVPDASTIALACFGALPLLALRKKVFR